MARWPHPGSTRPDFDDFALSGSGFPVAAPGFDETAFDLGLNRLI